MRYARWGARPGERQVRALANQQLVRFRAALERHMKTKGRWCFRRADDVAIVRRASSQARSSLQHDTQADVCIVGAGIAAMTTAYLLQREGKAVVVLDDSPVGAGMTQRTTAHLANAIDDRYFEIAPIHGEEGARLAAQSHTAAIACIEAVVREESIAARF